ncbi:hypothetical protein CR983_00640 [Candidatus Saccharibacteria bacterium]|nr:MAG: hypothetical protein CR983_00640 [Candidatus Saccharibacteria bacterium]
MARNAQTARIIDALIQLAIMSPVTDAASIADDLPDMLDPIDAEYLRSMDDAQRLKETKRLLAYVEQRGLIEREYDRMILTSRGKRRIYDRELATATIPAPAEWDGRWRLIIFDIPTGTSIVRSTFSAQLRRLGLQPLQQSVWVHPYPCRDQVRLIADTHGICEYICYIETHTISTDYALRAQFAHLLP